MDQIYVDYANLKVLAILPNDSELINQEIQSKLESSDELSYRLREQETSVFDLFAGEYICAVKWGGWSGTWHEGTEHLVISQAGEVQFRSRFGVATIKHLTVEGNTLSWSFDDNQTAASFTFKVDSEDSDSRQLMRAIYKDNSWEAVERGRLNEADVQFFQRWQQLLIEAQEREQLERERKQEKLGFDLEP